MTDKTQSDSEDDTFTQSMDAMKWAEAFCKRFKIWSDAGVETDSEAVSLMLGWFANAIMRGYDDGQKAALASQAEQVRKLEAHELELLAVIEQKDAALKGVLPFVVTQVVACHGLKCREAVCESCSTDADVAAQNACNAYGVANAALALTPDPSSLDAYFKRRFDEVMTAAYPKEKT